MATRTTLSVCLTIGLLLAGAVTADSHDDDNLIERVGAAKADLNKYRYRLSRESEWNPIERMLGAADNCVALIKRVDLLAKGLVEPKPVDKEPDPAKAKETDQLTLEEATKQWKQSESACLGVTRRLEDKAAHLKRIRTPEESKKERGY